MKNKIVECYMRQQLLENDYKNLKVVIIMTPKAFCELRSEEPFIECNRDIECYFIQLCGGRTPIKINNELPENVEFQIMQQKDYERLEQERILTELSKMFD